MASNVDAVINKGRSIAATQATTTTETCRRIPSMADDFLECKFESENDSSVQEQAEKKTMEILDSLPQLDRVSFLVNVRGLSLLFF